MLIRPGHPTLCPLKNCSFAGIVLVGQEVAGPKLGQVSVPLTCTSFLKPGLHPCSKCHWDRLTLKETNVLLLQHLAWGEYCFYEKPFAYISCVNWPLGIVIISWWEIHFHWLIQCRWLTASLQSLLSGIHFVKSEEKCFKYVDAAIKRRLFFTALLITNITITTSDKESIHPFESWSGQNVGLRVGKLVLQSYVC